MRRQAFALVALALIVTFISPAPVHAKKYPEPSIYPIAWQLAFKHGTPKRIVVNTLPYWYMTYTVTNNTGQEQIWQPDFQMLANDGTVIKSDRNIPVEVFDRIKTAEGDRFLQPVTSVSGPLHQGDGQAKDGVAIWKEPSPRMGHFSIFVSGLSGEYVILKDDDGKTMTDPNGDPLIVHKTLQLDYAVYGDELFPNRHDVHSLGEKWVMR